MISKLANSSFGERSGCVSDVPLTCLISVSGSLVLRSLAQAESIGRPLPSTSIGNIRPLLRLALCEMASTSLPALRCSFIQAQRSSALSESIAENGATGTLAQSLKNTLRCMFWLFGIDVHSYEQNAVNLPGLLYLSAIALFCCQTVPATFGSVNSLIGSCLAMEPARNWKTFCTSSGVFALSFAAIGSLLIGELGSFTRLSMPAYSE